MSMFKGLRTSKVKAFSLIELSIVLLVVGILIAAVIQGESIIIKSKIRMAQKITINSEVNQIENLAMWLETSLDNSVIVDSDSHVTRWHDINPQSSIKIDAYNTTSNLPVYVENGINGLPVLRFHDVPSNIMVDPDNSGMNFLAGTGYTIFVVEQKVDSGIINGTRSMFLSGADSEYSTNLQYGYWDDGFISNDWGYDWNIDIAFPDVITPRIHTLLFKQSTGKYYGMKSAYSNYAEVSGRFAGHPLISYNGAGIGGYGASDISLAEMIVFTRALKTKEVNMVESYLGKKYAIKFN